MGGACALDAPAKPAPGYASLSRKEATPGRVVLGRRALGCPRRAVGYDAQAAGEAQCREWRRYLTVLMYL